MHRALAHVGLPALVALGPAEALSLAVRYPITLLVTDFTMPGMTGVELADRIREAHPRIPVILVSGSPDASRLLISPPSAFLPKPVSTGQLADALASLVTLPNRSA
jgi:CheY-like chemotaxis protein